MPDRVTLADVRAARDLLDGVAVRTPMQSSRWLSSLVGGPVHLKAENLQRTGSFKIRGAYVRMSELSEEERARGVVAASAGNHAQGVALAAQLLGIKARVYMPEGAPIPKLNATRGYGAEVVFHGSYLHEALTEAIAYAERTGAVLIHPYDHPAVVAGQGTAGLEILEQAPEARTILVSLGGGGYAAGVALAVKEQCREEGRPEPRVVAVQAEQAAAYPASLAAGHPVPLTEMHTMADGIAVGTPGEVPFAAIEEYVDEVVTVSEESMSRAMVLLLERAKLVVEPAGAAAVAAVLDDPTRWETPAVAILSGGNVDPLLMGKLIRHGMAAAGRYLQLHVLIPDVPGGLAELLRRLAEAGANVMDVAHERVSMQLHLDEVAVRLQLETRGAEHAEALVARLRDQGYAVSE
ncbi:threonine ammonia-lyase [Marmoricola endophyticus]|uniref:L-threonine dehydratase catabolic TdcB n=1 Tax=Marmoricola endophyticus TaxID=2040280 RepID=A0A917BTP1_9ACTN|nr:threonine ammonia-lyase [Marmoricola endophyticus]GGF54076.1 threonine ammonia-lyase [Marmoricola endophyticus]